MNRTPLISVIVPVYNVEKYLDRCITSILTQTYTNLEIILVDDGSYDNSGDICDQYAAEDSRIVVIHKENGGLSMARNSGIEIASGEYLAFLDSDDWLDPDTYEIMMKAALLHDADTVVIGNRLIRNNHHWSFYKEKDRVLSTEQALKELIQNDTMKNYSTNKLYRKKLYDGVRYPEGKLFEDMPVAYKLFYKSNKVVELKDVKYNYYLHSSSIVANMNVKMYVDFCVFTQERYLDLKDKLPQLEDLMMRKYASQSLPPLMDVLAKRPLSEVQALFEVPEMEKISIFLNTYYKRIYATHIHSLGGKCLIYILKDRSMRKLKFYRTFLRPMYRFLKKAYNVFKK